MFILPQEYRSIYIKELETYIHDLLFTLQLEGRTSDFPKLIEAISYNVENLARQLIVEYLQKMDEDFKNSGIRKERYYIKDRLPRTIVCMFGEITYERTIYIDKDSGRRYIYVDRKMGIRPRIRYGEDVRAYAYECYGDENSMIKIGKELGNLIHCKFSLKRNDEYALSRQTIHNFLKVKPIHYVPERKRKVSRVFILLDEKFIGGQYRETKIMGRSCMIYEEVKRKGKKNVLTGKTFISSTDRDFGYDLLTYLDEIYELEHLKEICCMGDGGSWIKEAFDNLNLPGVTQIRCLDKFHSCRALYELCKDLTFYQIALYYVSRRDHDSFNKAIKGFVRDKKDTENYGYLTKHFEEIVNMYYSLGPCAMEQCICHHLMSQFTSVPKAYSSEYINGYLSMRDNYRNGVNLKKLYLEARQEERKNREVTVINKTQLDFSIFDKGNDLPYYRTANLKGKLRFLPV